MEELATYRVKLASFLQMTFFGVPCVYYGDEVGMQGGSDPFNRGTYPWRSVDPELREWYRRLAQLRNQTSCLRLGEFQPLHAAGDLYVYARINTGGRNAFGKKADYQMAICAVNRGFEAQQVELDLREFDFNEFDQGIFASRPVQTENGKLIFDIAPVGTEFFLSSMRQG